MEIHWNSTVSNWLCLWDSQDIWILQHAHYCMYQQTNCIAWMKYTQTLFADLEYFHCNTLYSISFFFFIHEIIICVKGRKKKNFAPVAWIFFVETIVLCKLKMLLNKIKRFTWYIWNKICKYMRIPPTHTYYLLTIVWIYHWQKTPWRNLWAYFLGHFDRGRGILCRMQIASNTPPPSVLSTWFYTRMLTCYTYTYWDLHLWENCYTWWERPSSCDTTKYFVKYCLFDNAWHPSYIVHVVIDVLINLFIASMRLYNNPVTANTKSFRH